MSIRHLSPLIGPTVMVFGVLLFTALPIIPERLGEKWSGFAMTVFTTGAGMSTPAARRSEAETTVQIEADKISNVET